jgi:(methylthio)acryloyl-CoA hydratase
MDMILTGRIYSAEDGQSIGLSTYLVDEGKGFAIASELAERIATNTPMTNFAAVHMLPRIAESDPMSGFAAEALIAAVAQADDEAKARLNAFLEKRGPKVKRV